MIGRDQELAKLRALLETERVVALVGPSGVGKTTIARTLLDEFADPLFIDCFGLTPADLTERLRGVSPSLLLLDNWTTELQIPDESHHRGAILVTSHVPPPDACVLPVLPFDVPSLANLRESAAFELLSTAAERALVGASVELDASSSLRLIEALGGHPLALAIAGQHAAMFGAEELCRLVAAGVALEDDRRDQRQRSLDRALAFSWQQFPQQYRRCLYLLARFRRPVRVVLIAELLGEAVPEVMHTIGELARRAAVVPGPCPRPLELWIDVAIPSLRREAPEQARAIDDRIFERAVASAPEAFLPEPRQNIDDAPSLWEAAVIGDIGNHDRPREELETLVTALLSWSSFFARDRYAPDFLEDVVGDLRSTRAHVARAALFGSWTPERARIIEHAWLCAESNAERSVVEVERALEASSRNDVELTLAHLARAREFHDAINVRLLHAYFTALSDPDAARPMIAAVLADEEATDRMKAALGPAAVWSGDPSDRVDTARRHLTYARGQGDLELIMLRTLADALDYDGWTEEAAEVRLEGARKSQRLSFRRARADFEAEQLFADCGHPTLPTAERLRQAFESGVSSDVETRIAAAAAVQAAVQGDVPGALRWAGRLEKRMLCIPSMDDVIAVARCAVSLEAHTEIETRGIYDDLMCRVAAAASSSRVEQLELFEQAQQLLEDHCYASRLARQWISARSPPFMKRLASMARSDADIVIMADHQTFRAGGAWHHVPELTGAVLFALAAGTTLDFDEIAKAVWPDETIDWEALVNRVNVRIAALRKCGLRPHLIKASDGFVLEGTVEIEPS